MFSDYLLTDEDIESFGALIPDYCVGPLREGSLYGLVVINEDNLAAPVVGIVLYRFTEDYIEVEWVALTADYDLPVYGADMVMRLLNKARISGGVRGVRARFMEGDSMSEYFPEYEFERRAEQGGVYRFTLADVSGLKGYSVKEVEDCCVALSDADNKTKNLALDAFAKSDEALPISAPVDWDSYEQELSFIFAGKEGAEGCILVERNRGRLVLSFLYSVNHVATMTLLRKAFNTAKDKYGGDCEVLCPVINGVSEGLVEKIVQNPEHDEYVYAEAVTSVGTGTISDFEYYSPEHKEVAEA